MDGPGHPLGRVSGPCADRQTGGSARLCALPRCFRQNHRVPGTLRWISPDATTWRDPGPQLVLTHFQEARPPILGEISMIEQALRPATLRDLKTGLHGELICPHDDGYDAARKVWNGMIDKYPALIVRCADQTDVINSIRFAQSQRLPVAMRSGGHSLAGISVCDGGLVIDLSPMKGVIIDPNRRRARVQAGLTLGEFVQATQTFGLATTTGTVAGTGLAGLTLGGGLGWFMGKYGLTIDNLLSVDLVTADGRALRASASEHPDLFWGVRGGGGNFGIVTAFEFQLHPVGQVLAGKVVYPMEQAREVLRFYREYTSTAPDELTAYASLRFSSPSATAVPWRRANDSSSQSGSLARRSST